MLNDLDRFHLVMDVIDRVPVAGQPRRDPAPGDGRRPPRRPRLHPRARRGRPGDHRLDLAGRGLTGAGPRRQRRLVQPEAAPARRRRHRRAQRRPARGHRRIRASPAWPAALHGWPAPDAVGHRIVHGGTRVHRPGPDRRRTCAQQLARPDRPRPAAPAEVAGRARRGHARSCPACPPSPASTPPSTPRSPPAAATYALPREWRERYAHPPLRLPRPVPRLLLPPRRRAARPAAASLRIVTCHLGAGASLAAVLDGRSVDTTMGFTPLDGLVMATRSGTVDPGLVLWLEEHEHLSPHDVSRRAGAALRPARPGRHRRHARGRGGRGPAASRTPGWPSTSTCTGWSAGIAAMAAAAGGLDVLAFTGGVGEHSPTVRQASGRAARPSSASPSTPPATTATTAQPDRDISAAGTAVQTLVIAAREDLEIAREVRQLLQG